LLDGAIGTAKERMWAAARSKNFLPVYNSKEVRTLALYLKELNLSTNLNELRCEFFLQ
jgi:hypothetical protein